MCLPYTVKRKHSESSMTPHSAHGIRDVLVSNNNEDQGPYPYATVIQTIARYRLDGPAMVQYGCHTQDKHRRRI